MSDGIPSWNPSQAARDKAPKGQSAKKAAPKSRSTRAKPSSFKLPLEELEDRMNGAIEFIGGGAMMAQGTVWAEDGTVLVACSEDLAASWRKLAEINPFVRKFLDTMFYSGATMEALLPTIMVSLSLLANHGLSVPMVPVTPFAVHEMKANAKMARKMEEAFEDMDPADVAAFQAMMTGAMGANPTPDVPVPAA